MKHGSVLGCRLVWLVRFAFAMTLGVALAISIAAPAAAEDAGGPSGSGVHRLALPDARRVDSGDWADIDAVAGHDPCPDYPRGTVVVAQATAHEPSPTVTEWDVATGALVRSAALPLPATQADLRIARTGSDFHVVATRSPGGPVVYARLSATLHAEQVEPLGSGERARVATDGHVVAILWSGQREGAPDESGWQLVVIDGFGRKLGALSLLRTNVSTFLYGQPLAVADGHVFILLPNGGRPSLLRLGVDARVEAVAPLPWSPDDGRLLVSQGRLLFTDDCAIAELWPPAPFPEGSVERLPGRELRGRACSALDATADGRGAFVTSQGDVLSPTLRRECHFADPGDAIVRPLWLFGAPALLAVERSEGRAWLAWGEGS